MKQHRRSFLTFILSAALILISLPAGHEVYAAGSGIDSLTDAQKNSSYGFFVWLSENADTSSEREDAEVAVQVLTNSVSSSNHTKVFNNGNISGGSGTLTYQDLLNATSLGAQYDATSLNNLRQAIDFVSLGNTYRAKESLAPLKISSGMMAMAELDVNVQGNKTLDHSNVFNSLENLAYRMIGGTWQYGTVGGGASDDPYEGWYTQEKNNYDTNNGGQTGHYKTMTDRQGVMVITGFGVRDRFATQYITASDGKDYPCNMHQRYYSQHYSTRSGNPVMYNIGTGVTPEKYTSYLNRYTCEVIGHSWDEGKVTRTPTCMVKGIREFTCTACSATKTEYIDFAAHKLTSTAAVTPSCTEDGNIKYYTCSVCSKHFSDSSGNNEISLEDTVLEAKGHKPEVVKGTPPTCTEDGLTDGSRCSVCKQVLVGQQKRGKLGHDYVVDPETAVAATCTSAGKNADKKCSRCTSVITGGTVNALGHSYKDVPDSAVTATCTKQGKTADQKCERCGYTFTGCVIPKTQHNWMNDYTEDIPATHNSEGLRSIHCADCGAIREGYSVVIPVIEHTYGDWTVDKEAKCEEPGSKWRECTECHYIDNVVIPATDHSWEGSVTVDFDASCTESGQKSIHCINCEKVKDITEIPPKGHLLSKQPGVPPTYNDAGIADSWICSRCNHIFADVNGTTEISAPAAIPSINESLDDAVTKIETILTELSDIQTDMAANKQALEAAGALSGNDAVSASEAALSQARSIRDAANDAKAKADKAVAAALAIIDAVGSGDQTVLDKANEVLRKAKEVQQSAQNILDAANDNLTAAETQTANVKASAAAQSGNNNEPKSSTDSAAKARAAEAAEYVANGNAYIDPSLPKVTLKSAKKAKKSFTAKWKKLGKNQQKLVKGIEIEYSLTSDFSNPVFKTAGKKKTSVKIKKLMSKKTYYVRAHTYVIRNGVKYVSYWSKVKTVKTK